jgi:DNA-nicking Smr family endonuclease
MTGPRRFTPWLFLYPEPPMPRRRRPSSGGRRSHHDLGSLYPTLDLHGETAESARRIAAEWLRRQRASGERLVRLITGRGKHSVGPPVLREEIERLLSELRGELVGRVEAESGGGALRVELRSPKDVPVQRAPRPTVASPELLREAREALADLGVAETPELLEAEVRRLRSLS